MSTFMTPHDAILVFLIALSGMLCVAGYLFTFALTRRLRPAAIRPTLHVVELGKPLLLGMMLGTAILFCHLDGDSAEALPDSPVFPALSILTMVGLTGVGAGGWAARRETSRVVLPAADLVRRLCVAGNTREDATARVAVRLALAAGYDPARASDLMAATSLHDVGKTGLAPELLRKTGVLDPAERKLLQSHTRLGFRMLANNREPMLDLAAEIALHHHENWDGTGYPCGLAGEAIPLAGRIVAVADTFDELMASGAGLAEIGRTIERRAGTQLDPRLSRLLIEDLAGMAAARIDAPADGFAAGAPRTMGFAEPDAAPLAAWLRPGRFEPVQTHPQSML